MANTNEPERRVASSAEMRTRCCPGRKISLLALGIAAGAIAVILTFYFVPSFPSNPPRDLDQGSEKGVSTMGPVAVNDANFASEVLKSDLPVLVDFWARWCSPCRAMNPVVEAIAREYAGQVKVVKIDVDEAPEIAAQFGVTSIPTFVVVQSGKAQTKLTGAQPKETLMDALTPFVGHRLGNGPMTQSRAGDAKVCRTG